MIEDNSEEKIKTQEELAGLVQGLRKQDKKIVAVSGSFDFFHLGHIKLFQRAKQRGDVLFVLLNSDKSISAYKARPPVMPEHIRARTISCLNFVNYVVLFDELTPVKVLEKIKPDVYCIGPGWGKNCIERKVIEDNKGEIYVLPRTEAISTSELVNRVFEHYSKPSNKAVFLDRDGTINLNEPKYIYRIEDFKFMPGAVSALKKLSGTDYKIIIVTNQSGIGRGYYTEDDLKKLHQWMLGELKREGVRIDKIYYCPHRPDDKCECRKPGIGMFMKAVDDFSVNLSKSWMVGDHETDIIAARQANIMAIKIGAKMSEDLKLEPHFYAKDLFEAVDIIIRS